MRDLTPQEMSHLAQVNLPEADLAVHWDFYPNESFETAVNYLLGLRQRLGLQPQKPEEIPTTDGQPAQSTPATELDPSDPNYVKAGENGWPVKEEAPVAAETPVAEPEAPEVPSAPEVTPEATPEAPAAAEEAAPAVEPES